MRSQFWERIRDSSRRLLQVYLGVVEFVGRFDFALHGFDGNDVHVLREIVEIGARVDWGKGGAESFDGVAHGVLNVGDRDATVMAGVEVTQKGLTLGAMADLLDEAATNHFAGGDGALFAVAKTEAADFVVGIGGVK
jgi:hypothetical protein